MTALTKYYAKTAEHQKAYVSILARGVRVSIIHIRVCVCVCEESVCVWAVGNSIAFSH